MSETKKNVFLPLFQNIKKMNDRCNDFPGRRDMSEIKKNVFLPLFQNIKKWTTVAKIFRVHRDMSETKKTVFLPLFQNRHPLTFHDTTAPQFGHRDFEQQKSVFHCLAHGMISLSSLVKHEAELGVRDQSKN